MSRKGWPVPWSPKDIKNYCKVHKEDSPARLMLILHIYTDCRIGDALWLGASHEKKKEGLQYIVQQSGEPSASADALGKMFKKWCRQASLENRSTHGIRKMVAGLMASEGADSHAIAALLGHTSTKTTEVYTRNFNRQIAVASASAKLNVTI